jgi:hypothetical protein
MNFERVSKLVARSLGVHAGELQRRLREATPGDMGQVLALRRSAFGDQIQWDDSAYLEWRYRRRSTKGAYSTLLVFEDSGRVAATIGLSDLPLVVDGVPVDAVGIMDLAVDAALSGTGLGPWLNLAATRSHDLALAIGSNEHSRSTVERLFRALCRRTHLVYPLALEPFLSRRARLPNAVARLLRPIDLLTRRRRRQRADGDSAALLPVEEFDASHDSIWNAGMQCDGVSLRRTFDYLNWRFFENTRADYRGFVFVWRGKPAGHAILRLAASSNGIYDTVVSDWSTIETGSSEAIHALFRSLLANASESGCSSLRVTAYGEYQRAILRRAGFWEPSRTEKAVWGMDLRPAGTALCAARGKPWHATDALSDGDGF